MDKSSNERTTQYLSSALHRRISYRDKLPPSLKKDEDDYVGFASLPEQVHRKAVKRGFDFTLMVVGESGLGKSTLVSSLFLTDLYKDKVLPTGEDFPRRTVQIEERSLEIVERGVKLRLTVVDTPGFNDSLDCANSWKSLVDYIDSQFSRYFDDEVGVNRKPQIIDHRVHCCLYFVSPYGHGLRPVDIVAMKNLHKKVNIVPVIAKADCLSQRELRSLKDKIMRELGENEIEVYHFPDCNSDEDEEVKEHDKQLKAAFPFAVVGSNCVVEVSGKKVRGRVYPWGIVEVDNPNHCDFSKLRQMIISTHMQDLKEVTADFHYENFRMKHLSAKLNKSQNYDSQSKPESEADAERLLAQKEAEIEKMQSLIARMEQQLNVNPASAGAQRPTASISNGINKQRPF